MPYRHDPILWSKEDIEDITSGEWILNEPDSLYIKGKCLVPELCGKDFLYMAYGKNAVDKRMDLLQRALNKGASLIITDTKDVFFPPSSVVLYVKKPHEVNKRFAIVAREKTNAKVIAVTGSVGKTSTKDMITEMLSCHGLTYSNFRSINGGSGLENELANVSTYTKYCVLELGMKAPNTIRPMSLLLKPHVALITNIAPAHLCYHSGMDSIVRTKVQIAEGLAPGGIIILPRDSEYFSDMKNLIIGSNKNIKLCTFGKSKNSDIQLVSHESSDTHSEVKVIIYGKKMIYKVPFTGDYKIYNSLAAIAVIFHTGVDIVEAVKGLSFVNPSFRRGERFKIELKKSKSFIELIDDTWNANPLSMRESIQQIGSRLIPVNGRRVAILGDMEELGEKSLYFHKELVKIITMQNIAAVYTVGTYMEGLYNELPESIEKIHSENVDNLISHLDLLIKKNDVVLVKGSNKMAMYKVVLHFIGSYDFPRAQNHWTLLRDANAELNY